MTGIEVAAYVAAAAAVAGGVAAYAGSQSQAKAIRRQGEEARTAGTVEDSNAEAEASRLKEQNARRRATAFNNAAANGVDATTGTPLDLMADIAADQSLDEQIMRWRGRQANVSANRQAAGLSVTADDTETQGYWAAGTTVLTSGARLYGSYGSSGGAGGTTTGGRYSSGKTVGVSGGMK